MDSLLRTERLTKDYGRFRALDGLNLAVNRGEVRIDDKLVDYINKIVRLTRQWPQFHMGASPR